VSSFIHEHRHSLKTWYRKRWATVHLLATLAQIVRPAARHPQGIEAVLRHLDGIGLFILAIADGSPIPTFSGPDILAAILAARRREPWYYYAGIATVGSVLGSYLTFRIAHRAGLDYLNRKFGQRRVVRLLEFFQRWGTGALAVSALLPFPFPTSAFFAIAGVLDYPLRTFIMIVTLARALRYGAIAVIASLYGRRFVVGLRHPGRHPGWLLAMTAAAAIVTAVVILLARRIQSNGPEVSTNAM
jgi:membrane protein YqaA with SNARE-associated domain